MGHLRQTYLGPSPQQTLCIMPCYHQRPSVPTGECFIRKMPDELLYRTLEYLAPAPDSCGLWDYGPCLPIPLVCRRWKHLFSSILYRNIGFHKATVKQLDATLRQRPELGDAVRGVGIILIPEPSDAICEMVAYILRCCKGLRKFMLDTGKWTGNIWIVLNAAKRAPLATLDFRGGSSLQMILKHFSLPTLEEVYLTYYQLGEEDEPDAPMHPFFNTAHEGFKLLLSSTSPSNVTTMVLKSPRTSVDVTRSFLQWPARLTSLTMEACFGRLGKYSVEDVQGILDAHRDTLQHISLPVLVVEHISLPDFSSFTSLESLQIHGFNLFGELPCRAASKLEAPILRHLEINLDLTEWVEFEKEVLGPEKILWLERFVGCVKPGTNKLETVFLSGFESEDDDDTWPWAYIDEAVGIFAAYNVAMTYTQPEISREEWYRGVEQRKMDKAWWRSQDFAIH